VSSRSSFSQELFDQVKQLHTFLEYGNLYGSISNANPDRIKPPRQFVNIVAKVELKRNLAGSYPTWLLQGTPPTAFCHLHPPGIGQQIPLWPSPILID
jgi:hypothetical protein